MCIRDRAQITEYFVDRYGAWVELEPPANEHQALFYAPLAALGIGLLCIVIFGGRKREVTSPPPVELDPNLAPWRARILAEIEGIEE